MSSVESPFICDCKPEERPACQGEPRYKDTAYCVFHFPSEGKKVDFRAALDKKLQDPAKNRNFHGVWFPQKASFRGRTFNALVCFTDAIFNGEADFTNATFEGDANFSSAQFLAKAKFGDAKFKGTTTFWAATFGVGGGAEFNSAIFAMRVIFESASFQDIVHFRSSTFLKQVNFGHTTFADYVNFEGNELFGNKASLDLHAAKIGKPEHVYFHSVRLRPQWFVNVDPRKFAFTNVKWDFRVGGEKVYRDTCQSFQSPDVLLATTYGQLAVNAEENNRFEEASRFHYLALNARRPESAHRFAFWKLSWWYWLASGYGERAWQAALGLLGLWLLFAFLFFLGQQWWGHWWQPPQARTTTAAAKPCAEKMSPTLGLREALVYSAGVITLQKPEPLPCNKTAKSLVLLETILGPVQAALLALAIRRKFMR